MLVGEWNKLDHTVSLVLRPDNPVLEIGSRSPTVGSTYDHGRPAERARVDEISIWAKDRLIAQLQSEVAGLKRWRDLWPWPMTFVARTIRALEAECQVLRTEVLRLEHAAANSK